MKVERDGNRVKIEIVLNTENPPVSSTGKSYVLFTSKGFKWYGDIGISLTVIKMRGRQ